jgi:tRNA (Thr-GGU) A37 N-methylase
MKKIKIKKYCKCSRCNKKIRQDEMYIIDDKFVCSRCIYGSIESYNIYPIGVVKNNLKRGDGGFDAIGKKGVSCIELLESQRPFLYRLEEEKNITVLYFLHEIDSIKSVFKRGLDGKRVGVFASRTPYRLSKIGIQDVKLIKIEGKNIYVENLDAINNTPVLDIKMSWKGRKKSS